MSQSVHQKRWNIIAMILFVLGAVVALGIFIPSLILADMAIQEMSQVDILKSILAFVLFLLAGFAAKYICPKLTSSFRKLDSLIPGQNYTFFT